MFWKVLLFLLERFVSHCSNYITKYNWHIFLCTRFSIFLFCFLKKFFLTFSLCIEKLEYNFMVVEFFSMNYWVTHKAEKLYEHGEKNLMDVNCREFASVWFKSVKIFAKNYVDLQYFATVNWKSLKYTTIYLYFGIGQDHDETFLLTNKKYNYCISFSK